MKMLLSKEETAEGKEKGRREEEGIGSLLMRVGRSLPQVLGPGLS